MATYIVGFDLVREGANYNKRNRELTDAIQQFPRWWHGLDSTWVVKSPQTAPQIRDSLAKHLDSNDRLLVTKLDGTAAWSNFNSELSNWLTNNLGTNVNG